MDIDGFLKIPDIQGASQRDGHENEIECFGIEFGMVAPHDPNSQGRQGRVALDFVRILKHYDKSSPYIKKACFDNKMLGEVQFTARRTIDGRSSDYLIVKFTEATVSNYNMHPSGDGTLVENVAFAYRKITFIYDKDDEVEMDVRVGK